MVEINAEDLKLREYITRMEVDPELKLNDDQLQRLIAQKKWEHIMGLGKILDNDRARVGDMEYVKNMRDSGRTVIFHPYLEYKSGKSDMGHVEVIFRTMFHVQ